jgi:dienelactone hydrolase
VLVSHAWAGRTAMEEGFARRVAEMGYAAFALDLYGKGVAGKNAAECQSLMTPFMADRALLARRLNNILSVARALPEVDAGRIAIIGFCFGGLCALDLARSGADIAGAASFHGLFTPPPIAPATIRARIILFHGWDDPMAKPEDALAIATELTRSGADWQMHAYGGVMHAFTNSNANDPGFGTVYHARADRRSFAALEDFLAECFA